MNKKLYELDNTKKILLACFLIVLSIGVGLGILYVYLTTSMTVEGTEVRYAGDLLGDNYNDEVDILENYPKSFTELVSHSHNHIVQFTFIFFLTALIFERNSIISGYLKRFLMIEGFGSIILTFGGFFLIRFLSRNFSYLVMSSSFLMYLTFYTMVSICLYEIFFKKSKWKEFRWQN